MARFFINRPIVAMVMSMGFSENAGKRAALATHNRNAEEVYGHPPHVVGPPMGAIPPSLGS